MLRDVARFLRSGPALIDDARFESASLADLVSTEGYSREFRDHFLVPLTASIWSSSPVEALSFPAVYALRFFDNHGMLGFRRHRWKAVVGGSREYVRAMLEATGWQLRLGCAVRAVTRRSDGVEIRDEGGESHLFDRVVIATHGDEALALLADPSEDERRLLGAFRSTRNEAVLHTDDRLLPSRSAARASWNFHLADCRAPVGKPTITYYLNRLQRLSETEHYCVTLNRSDEVREERVIERIVYHHPLFTHDSIRAQVELPMLNTRTTVFCGAYHGYGFHEDGLVSGLAAAKALGVDW